MALRPPRISETDDQNADSSRRSQPIRPVWQGALIWLFGIGLLLIAVGLASRLLVVPALSGSSAPSPAEAHLGALQTQEALTPQSTAVPVRIPTTAPTVAPTAVVVPAAAPTTQPQRPTPAATQPPTSVASVSAPSTNATAAPTVAPELVAEVSAAYLRYFQVRADALLQLDPSSLDQVAEGDALVGLQREIEQDREAGRAIRIDVVHNYTVASANNDEAQVADDYRDSSVFVDPVSREPLAGEVVPDSPQNAPEVKVVYQLHRISGVWKVIAGQKYE
jgi:hypothetical protein